MMLLKLKEAVYGILLRCYFVQGSLTEQIWQYSRAEAFIVCVADSSSSEDIDIELFTQVFKVTQRTQVCVWGVVPLVRQGAGARHFTQQAN